MTQPSSLLIRLEAALAPRLPLLDAQHKTALRLFNGFLEGCPELVAELYADTLVLINHADQPLVGQALVRQAQQFYQEHLPWIVCVVVKTRCALDDTARRGVIVYGEKPANRLREGGVWYALDLTLNQDTSFYLDTRNLRQWALEHLARKRVLNTFAYTGSLGVAARAAGATQVIHTDRNRQFLNLAKTSYTLNGSPIARADFRGGDFFSEVSALKRNGESFDCVFLDPPFFSTTSKGIVNLVSESARLINKVRPLVRTGGWLVAVNNALFVSGADYLRTLEELCADGYLTIETLIPVPEDCCGYAQTRQRSLPVDPAPFNHATKIAVLRVGKHQPQPPTPSSFTHLG